MVLCRWLRGAWESLTEVEARDTLSLNKRAKGELFCFRQRHDWQESSGNNAFSVL